MSSSVMITCTYTFTADDNHLQTSTILNSAVCHYTGHQYMPSTQVSPILSEKLTKKSYGTFAIKVCYTRSLLIIWWYLLYHLKSYLAKIVRMVLNIHSTTICKLVDLIPALHQSDCRIPNWVSAKTVLSCSTNHGQTTARFRSFFR